MDGIRFDDIAKALAASAPRRRALGGLAGGILAVLLGRAAGAREQAAQAGDRCLGEKTACKHGLQCCSGLCTGKPGKKRCRRAPGQGTCTTDRFFCQRSSNLVECNGNFLCTCLLTAQGTAFCGSLSGIGCDVDCATNADCTAAGFPSGSACVSVGPLGCNLCAGGPTACALPCGPEAAAARDHGGSDGGGVIPNAG